MRSPAAILPYKHCVCRNVVLIGIVAIFAAFPRRCPAAPDRPNIVIIYSDDVGYGDVGCYGATKVSTPNIDRLASGGLRFTDAHSTASTCTPSRYSILTGQYSFRNKKAEILPGDAPLLIKPGTRTLPLMLQQSGYATACIGKWHLGLGGRENQLEWADQSRSFAAWLRRVVHHSGDARSCAVRLSRWQPG